MLPIEQLVYPIADALQMDMEYKWTRLYGTGVFDIGIVPKVPITLELKIVDSIVDTACGTAGVLAKFKGSPLYLAIINDDRVKELTFFAVDGSKAGINYNLNTGRVNNMDKWQRWSRKKFYAMIAPGVRATFNRPSVVNDWDIASVGPSMAIAYLAKRDAESGIKPAKVINEQNAKDRQLALTGVEPPKEVDETVFGKRPLGKKP